MNLSQSKSTQSGVKWVRDISPDGPVSQAARRVLKARLGKVWHWLPWAAERSDENAEYVHQLRVATRRAVEAVRVFSELIPKTHRRRLRRRLRQVRCAADAARDLDVLRSEFDMEGEFSGDDVGRSIAASFQQCRREAQGPIVAVYHELKAADFSARIKKIVKHVHSNAAAGKEPTFEQYARRYFSAALDKFFRAANSDLADDASLHQFRIQAKKLRYTMELVAIAFKPAFRKSLYGRIAALQDALGMLNDHATAEKLFRSHLELASDPRKRAFFRGALAVETKAHQDLLRAFNAVWTPQAFRKLRRQFQGC